jgi:pimeloyl-[acyl-carrier protein] synthase
MSTPVLADHKRSDPSLSLFNLLDPTILANPYPLYARLRSEDPVHWDSFLHAWTVTRYDDVTRVLKTFSADRTPTPAHLEALGLEKLTPIAQMMVRQMLFMDAPSHTRIRRLAAFAFTPARVSRLRDQIQNIVDSLIDSLMGRSDADVIADIASPLPAIVTAHMLGVPASDHLQLKLWSADFAEMLGNFQHNPNRIDRILKTVEGLTHYFRRAIADQRKTPTDGLIDAFLNAEEDGDRLTEEEIIANCVVTMVGGQETTTNLIGNGLLTLFRNPEAREQLTDNPELLPSAVEELLRYESPSQHTGRIAPADVEMGGHVIHKGQAVLAVMAAANRDPDRFPDPDRLCLTRPDNHHRAFGWAAHFCFGAPLARIEAQIAFGTILRRLTNLQLKTDSPKWRFNLGLRGLVELPVQFSGVLGAASNL